MPLMAPGGKTERATGTRPTVLRANPVQASILKNAFVLSNVASPEQLKALSQATNLPEKWIHQWFGRQRVKDRKAKSKADPAGSTSALTASVSAADLSTSTSISASSSASLGIGSNPDAILSAQEILHIKQEHHDPVPTSLLPALLSCDLDNIPSAPAVSVSRLKRRGRAPRGPKQDQAQDNIKAPVAKRRTRRRSATQVAHVKAEFIEPSKTLENVPKASGQQATVIDLSGNNLMAANPSSGRATRAGTQPSVDYIQLLPMIGPPRRSSFSQAARDTQRSNLRLPPLLNPASSDNTYPISQAQAYIPLPESSHQTTNEYSMPSLHPQDQSASAGSAQAYLEGPAPAFRSAQFHNQGPWDYSLSSSMLASSRPASDTSGRKTRMGVATVAVVPEPVAPLQYIYDGQDVNYRVPRLAPAFNWESHVPPVLGVSITSMRDTGLSQPESVTHSEFRVENEGGISVHPVEDFSSESLMYPELDLSAFETFLTGTVLDPLLAPLKHLTDILENFKDDQGTYMPLMQEEQRERLMDCLLDESLAERSPFQAAMGLSLLSKLGVEWEV